ncbi:MAG: FAD-dependent oxidoreductase [Thalassobaculum sp.]
MSIPLTTAPVHVVGGGLAGSEAAWQLAQAGVPVVLHEMRPVRGTAAHQTDHLAELVCSNSFRSDDHDRQRGRRAARGDAALRVPDHGSGRRASGAGGLGPGGRPGRVLRRRARRAWKPNR